MLVLLVWMMSSIEPRFHHRRAVRPAIKLTRARYPVWYHHVLNAAGQMTCKKNRPGKPVFYRVVYVYMRILLARLIKI